MHGDEWYGVAALLQLGFELRGRVVAGSVTLVPCANIDALVDRSRESARLAGDLNRQFVDGPLHGRPIRRLAEALWRHCVSGADVVVDIHSGGPHRLLAHARIEGDPAPLLPLVQFLGLRYVVVWRRFPRGLMLSRSRRAGSLSFGIEVGTGYELRQNVVEDLVRRLTSLLVGLGVVRGRSTSARPPIIYRPGAAAVAGTVGIFTPVASPGTLVKRRQTIGRLRSLETGETAAVRASRAGLLFSVLTLGPVGRSDELCEIMDPARRVPVRTGP
ncbi:MAG: succinylglutamate desuccinylase/aspartoacylase family protein [Deltaproteobacteria bacterium]|nr:succinylglutamate desuccinylase/aspartoacylase family protein [Deltaproteobacteria bacterium]